MKKSDRLEPEEQLSILEWTKTRTQQEIAALEKRVEILNARIDELKSEKKRTEGQR